MLSTQTIKHSLVSAGLALLLLGAPTAAQADDDPAEILEVCEGESVSLLAADGTPLGEAETARMIQSVSEYCEADQPVTNPKGNGPVTNATTTPNGTVTAYITASPGLMTISGYAVGVTGSGAHELQCIYRRTGGTWNSCGYGTGGSSITTSSVSFCPPVGILYTANVTLYINGVAKGSDTAGKYSL